MKLTLGQIQSIINNSGFTTFISKALPIKTSFDLLRLRKKMGEELVFFNEKKNEFLQKYSEKDAEGNMIQHEGKVIITSEKVTEFNEKMLELLKVECNIADCEKIKINIKTAPTINGQEAEALIDIIELI